MAQTRGAHPMVPPTSLRSRTMSVAATAGFPVNSAFYGMIFLFGLHLQRGRGLTSLAAGLAFVPRPC